LKLNKYFYGMARAIIKEISIYALTLFSIVSFRGFSMHSSSQEQSIKSAKNNNGALLLGAGLAVTSMIILPAFAMRLGLGASLTGALRIALMKASSKAVQG
jgi:hypothetical protein